MVTATSYYIRVFKSGNGGGMRGQRQVDWWRFGGKALVAGLPSGERSLENATLTSL
jgi:hypothetical protein